MKDRILQIMQKEGLSNVEFAEKLGISTSSLSHIFSGRNKACPYINLNWLLYGDGEMEETTSPISHVDLFTQTPENREIPTEEPAGADFRKENPSGSPVYVPKEIVREEVKYIEKPHPKITEIRIFFDNGTYEVFKPEK